MIDPVRAEVWVPASPDAAYGRFTDGIGVWWPSELLSVSGEAYRTVRFLGPRDGGPPVLVEEDADGCRHLWAEVRGWHPGAALAMAWFPGREPSAAQEVEVGFRADGEGTRVSVLHAGWHAAGEDAPGLRHDYGRLWDRILACFKGAFERSTSPGGGDRPERRAPTAPTATLDGLTGRGYAVVESLSSLGKGRRLTGVFLAEARTHSAERLHELREVGRPIRFRGTVHHRDRSGPAELRVSVTRVAPDGPEILVEFAADDVPYDVVG